MAALDGVYEKIERARVHQADLARRVRDVLGDDKQRFVLDPEPDRDTGRYALRVFGVPAIDPGWRTIIGDCVHNLRSALDHLAWQLVLLDGKKPGSATSFPVRRTRDEERPLLFPQVGNEDILTAIEAVQPYRDRGDPPDPRLNPLWQLHRLNIIDKHRLLVVVVNALDQPATSWAWSGDEPGPTFYFHPVAVQQDGTTVASFDFHGRRPPEDFSVSTALHLVINEQELLILTPYDVEAVLDSLIIDVELMLRSPFGPLFPPGTTRPMTMIRPVRRISP